VKTVADRYKHVAYITSTGCGLLALSTLMTLNHLEPPEERFLVNFLQFLAALHISRVNCDEMPDDRPRQPAYEIFSIKHRL